jgi:Asp-tRNA(Asn)/Glu-tRNA(Gln) amidotransferase A subunit family amidase
MDEEIFFLSAGELAARIRRGELSPVKLVDGLFERIRVVDRPVNAYCTLAEQSARAAARHAEQALAAGEPAGPLLGVPVSVKDNIETAGIRTTYGSRVFEGFVPSEDAVCVARLKRAGAIVVGKTSTSEFAAKGVVDPLLFGHTRNPWALDRTVGGSSGGAAAAVAAGMGPLAIGNDQAGSIRVPAAFCGVAGLKPTGGRVPFYPSDNLWDTVFHVGPLARSVADLDLALQVLEGPDGRDPVSQRPPVERWDRRLDDLIRPWRVAWSADLGFGDADLDVRAICWEAFEQLASLGSGDTPAVDLSDALEAYTILISMRRAASTGEVLDEWAPVMDPVVVDYIRSGRSMTSLDLGRGIRRRNALYAAVEAIFDEYDLLVTPTVAVTPFEIGQNNPATVNGQPLRSWRHWMCFTFPFNLTGHPAATVPAGWTDGGLPVGVQIVGPRWADRQVLAACRYLESARPWAHRRPPASPLADSIATAS